MKRAIGDIISKRAILESLGGIAVLLVVASLIMVFFFPPSVMIMADKMGLDEMGLYFAEKTCEKSDDLYNLNYAIVLSIRAKDYSKTEKVGEKMISKESFSEFCELKNEEAADSKYAEYMGDYSQYIYKNICLSKYYLGKKAEALDLAVSVNRASFERANAVALLALHALKDNDMEFAKSVCKEMNGLREKFLSDAQIAEEDKQAYIGYIDEILVLAKEISGDELFGECALQMCVA